MSYEILMNQYFSKLYFSKLLSLLNKNWNLFQIISRICDVG